MNDLPQTAMEAMRQDPLNPKENAVAANVSESDLIRAIGQSGYPLQGIVGNKLIGMFEVTPEWGFIDRDTKEERAIDLYAVRQLRKEAELPLLPVLVLLIECKRSVFPHVFFQDTTAHTPIPHYPLVAGTPYVNLTYSDKGREGTLIVPPAQVLGLEKLPFVQPGPPRCPSFARVTPTGSKKLELSGDEVFNNLVLPLVKASDHAAQLFRSSTPWPVLTLCVGVVDAPIVLVDSPDRVDDPVMTPWVRVTRIEAAKDSSSWRKFRHYAVDVVHVAFLDVYVQEWVLPFAEEFAKRAIQRSDVLARGGSVESIAGWEWDRIQSRPK